MCGVRTSDGRFDHIIILLFFDGGCMDWQLVNNARVMVYESSIHTRESTTSITTMHNIHTLGVEYA